MAKGDDLNKNLNETNKALFNAINSAARLTEETRNLTEELKDQLNIRSKQNEGEKTLLSLSRQITNSAQENKVALGQQGDIQKQIKKETNQLNSALREQSILSNNLNSSQIEQANKIAEINKARLQGDKNISKTQELLVSASGKEKEELEKKLVNQRIYLNGLDYGLSKILNSADAETQRLALSNQLVSSAQENLEVSKEEEATQERINRAMGVAGNVISGLKEIAGKFGKAFNLDGVADDMKKFAEETQRAEDELAKLEGREAKVVSRTAVLGKGLKSAFTNLGKTLTDPAVIIGALVKGFTDVQNAQKEFRSITGQNINQFDTLNTSILTSAEYIKSAANLAKELNVNAAVVFTPETIAEVGELTEQMGLGVKEAANLAKFSKLSGKELSNVTKNIESSTKNFIKTNKVGVNLKDVMSDVGGVSDSISLSLGGNPQKITDAALAARELGLALEQVDKIAGSLLNFESSISAELEAELLTGQQLNLEKARELALSNDLEGVAKELTKNQGVMNAFASGNRIQQEAVAKAMGMSREEMAQMIYQQQLQSNLSEEQAAKAANISLEEAKRLTVQKQISNALDKITQAFGGILTLITPILDNSVMLGAIVGTIATVYAVKLAKSFGSMAKDSFSTLKNVKDMAATAISTEGGIGAKLKAGLGMGDAGKDMEEIPDKTAESGKGIKGFLEGLGDGLASIGKQFTDVVKGAAALGITGLALGGSFALAMMMVEDVDPVQMIAFAGSLSVLGLTVALMGKVGNDIIKGALAMAILGFALKPAAEAFNLLEGVDDKSILAFSLALPILGLSVLGLGLIFSNPITAMMFGAGILGLVALGFALQPLAASFKMIGDAIKGNEIESTFSSLLKLSSIAPGIEATAEALHSIAGGLGAIADEGTAALPILNELNALGGATGGDDGGNSEMAQINANLERLISLVEQGGDVFLDGNKVGKSLQLASSKIG